MLVRMLARSKNYRSSGKQENKSEEKYQQAHKTAMRVIYQAKCKAERKRFGNFIQNDDQKCDVKRMAKLIRILLVSSI